MDVVTGDTQLSATKNDLIVELVQRELISESVLAPTILDVSKFAKKGAQSISFPKAGSFTVENRATGQAAEIQALTFATDQLDLEFRATVCWLIDSMDSLQSSVEVESEYAQRAARAHGVYLEQKIIAELEDVGVATSSSGDISDDVILEMLAALKNRKGKVARMSLAISPDQEAIMLKISKFVSAEQYGSAIVPSGALGRIYGVPVYVSTELGASQYFLYDKEGCALGFQRSPLMDERGAPEYGAGSKLKVLDQLFGVQGLQIAMQSVAAGKSALVVKDNN